MNLFKTMNNKDFKKIDLICGWSVFAVALTVYSLTVEPTLSFWDCGEYISTSAKLEVGHPPGAPFFQMVGAFLATFAPEVEKIALFVNYMSVLSSAFTVLFLYFIIVNLSKKIHIGENSDKWDYIAVFGSGVMGALTYTFSDSFWFNAVETEVYAMAMLFMSAMFWLGLKWTDNLKSPRGNKWLLMICLVVGLCFGVHFMALLTIPAIGMMYFFKSDYRKTTLNFFVANAVSIAILLVIFKLILPYTLAFFGKCEIWFVNELGLPFNSGTIFAAVVMVAFFIKMLSYSKKKNSPLMQTITLCLMFILVGFSSWIMIPIRANANVVINENSPTDARLLLAYYNLEQYPETHLFYGPMYTDKYAEANPEDMYMDEKPKYERDYKKQKYIIVNDYKDALMAPNKAHLGIMPRMWSSEHAANYMKLTKVPNFQAKAQYAVPEVLENIEQFKRHMGELDYGEINDYLSSNSQYLDIEKPSFFDNLQYFLTYQVGYMYFRYFMWNFAGRQDDIQGKMDNHGNWISGFSFIDEIHLGLPQKNLPIDQMENKGRNQYYFLPLIFGIIGLSYHFFKSRQGWWVVFVLFMFTGIALKVYLNERPFEPRERDYALVGSFFTFCIWVGMGILSIVDSFKDNIKKKILVPACCILGIVTVPANMAKENWDDHDRSDKFSARVIGKSYLDCVSKDNGAMLFTIGDNDTFPLWYMQEVEGYRTDVRIINTSLLGTDWYIDQMKRKAYKSEPIPSQIIHRKYAYGVRDAIYNADLSKNTWNIKDVVDWMESDQENTKKKYEIEMEYGRKKVKMYPSYPTRSVRIPVDKENVLKSGIVKAEDADKIVDYIDITLPSWGIGKNRMMMLDILANNNWKRPIYFTGGSMSDEEYIWMKDYLQLDGLVYKLVPIKTEVKKENPYDLGRIDSELMYGLVKNWYWGGMGSDKIYHDPETRRNSVTLRGNMARLIEVLIGEGKKDKAKEIIDMAVENMPVEYYGYYFSVEPMIEGYYKIGEEKKARETFEKVARRYQSELNYYLSLNSDQMIYVYYDFDYTIRRYASLIRIATNAKDKQMVEKHEQIANRYVSQIAKMLGLREKQEDFFNEQSTESDSIETSTKM